MEEIIQLQKVTLDRINQIFEERQQEFRLRDENFIRKQNMLADQEKMINEKMAGLRIAQNEFEENMKILGEKEKELYQRSEELAELSRRIERDNEMKEKVLMETAVLREEQRNEVLKAKRLREEYEEKLSALDPETVHFIKNHIALGQAEDKEEVEELQESNQRLKIRIQELEEENEQLSLDKQELLKRLFSGSSYSVEKEQSTSDPVEEPLENPEGSADEAKTMKEKDEDETAEELTADVLYKYLERTEQGASVAVRHSDRADQVVMERKGLSYHFVFDNPAYYDIRSKKKKTRYIRKMMEKFNYEQMGVKFSYDDIAGEIVATGYFQTDISAQLLIQLVYYIVGECFNEEE